MANHDTKTITIYKKSYQLPILEGNSFDKIQTQIKQRQQVIKHQKRTKKKLFGLYKTTEKLTFEEKFQELERLVKDYNQLIAFLTEHKQVYQQFFGQLTNDLKQVVTEKLKEAQSQERERQNLLREENDAELIGILENQKEQILGNVWLFGKAFLLMLKKIELISDGIEKITTDQDSQKQLLLQMVERLGKYKKVYALQRKITKSGKEAGEMAEAAVNLEEYLQPFIGSFQGLINEVCEQDNSLSGTVTEIQSLVEDIMASKTGSFMPAKADDLSKNMLDFLVTNEQKKERLVMAVENAQQQGIDWSWQQIDINDCGDLTQAISVLQSHLDGRLGEYGRTTLENGGKAMYIGERSPLTPLKKGGNEVPVLKKGGNEVPFLKKGGNEVPFLKKGGNEVPVLKNGGNELKVPLTKGDLGGSHPSEKNINYEKLDTLLSEGKWKKADQETADLMLKAMNKNSWGDVYKKDLLNFPKTDLRTMDQLWLNYSNGKFGFSVQKQIWIDCGGTPGKYDYEVAMKLGDRVGWRKNGNWLSYNELIFNTNSPQGHLPWYLGDLFSLV